MIKKYILPILIGVIGFGSIAYATTVFNSDQVGTGAASGTYLQTNGATSTWTPITFPSGMATTTINGVSGPTFTFSINATTSPSSITTSSMQLFLNLLYYSSSSDITITSTGTIQFASHNISQFINDVPYLTSSTGVTSVNGSHGAVTTVATTTLNGVNGPTFNFNVLGTAGQISSTVATSGGNTTTTLSLASTSVVAGSYTNCNCTFDAYGRATSASNGSAGSAAGATTNVQYNEGGQFAATSTLSYTSSTHVFVTAGTSTPTISAAFFTTASSATYSASTSVQSFTVPTNVTGSIVVNLIGGGGGGNGGGSSAGSPGGSTTGTILNPIAGTTYYLLAGGQGFGTADVSCGGTGCGGAGGQYSWIGTQNTFSQATALLVAGGGGGAGGFNGGTAGAGGGKTGNQGNGTTNSTGGLPGTQSAAGNAGTSQGAGTAATNGSNQTGGVGALCSGIYSGGSGGNGYWAGGGGGCSATDNSGSLGGGGSGFASSTLSSTSTATTSVAAANGNIKLTYTLLTSATLTGNNNNFQVVAGTPFTTSTITFAGNPFLNAQGVSCGITPNNATNTWVASATLQAFSIVFTNSIATGSSFNGWCNPY